MSRALGRAHPAIRVWQSFLLGSVLHVNYTATHIIVISDAEYCEGGNLTGAIDGHKLPAATLVRKLFD